jgi:hypothetical protein
MGVIGSIPVEPTIQSHQTADFQAESKWAVSAGISAGTSPALSAVFSWSSFSAFLRECSAKIPEFRRGLQPGIPNQ